MTILNASRAAGLTTRPAPSADLAHALAQAALRAVAVAAVVAVQVAVVLALTGAAAVSDPSAAPIAAPTPSYAAPAPVDLVTEPAPTPQPGFGPG